MKYPTVNKDYDLKLSYWGPFSKHLAGISHIENKELGEMLEFSVFPGFFRGSVQVPSELWCGNHYPWYAKDDLSSYTYRFELEWKDRVYVDVSYSIKDESTVLVKTELVNNTEKDQNLCIHYLANRYRPPAAEIKGGNFVLDPLCYDTICILSDNPLEGLNSDGKLICEELDNSYVGGHALGDLFGKKAGDSVKYSVDTKNSDTVFFHIKGNGKIKISGNPECEIQCNSDSFSFVSVPINFSKTLELTCLTEGQIVIDAIVFGNAGNEPNIIPFDLKARPQIEQGDGNAILEYCDMENQYGIAWQSEYSVLREYLTDNISYLMPLSTHIHTHKVIGSDSSNQYTDVFIRPIPLKAGETKILNGLICSGKKETIKKKLNDFKNHTIFDEFPVIPEPKNPYDFGQRLMKATLLTNIVFPIRIQGNYVRHFTPGKWWDVLYTWDNGFIALAFCDFSPKNAMESLEMYLTDIGNPHSAFIHHGSFVPVQAYVYKRLFDITGDKDFLSRNYASMRQYYDFYVGRDKKSHTKDFKSGLLSTFRYFYNSGGWDDYPPQEYMWREGLENSYTPVVNTAHAINFARIMLHAAEILGFDEKGYSDDIEAFKDALQKYSYDPESGYFSYVHHNENGYPDGILRHEKGQNYNMGLDGAYPMLVGACTEAQKNILADRIMSPKHLWTDIGISVVDKSAPYYRKDGYWNGSVWFPHQWFVFLGMLENGFDEYAKKIAFTAINIWKEETDYSYRCCEHFMVESGRGAGWMTFGALSSPVVMWYESMYKSGNVTLPLNLRMENKTITENSFKFMVVPCIAENKISTIIAVPHKSPQKIKINGEVAETAPYGDGMMLRVDGGKENLIEITY